MSTQVTKVWWDGEKLMAEVIPESEFYKPQEPQAYAERYYGSGKERGWWIVHGGWVKREHVAFLGESVAPEEVSKIVAALNAAHPQAAEPAVKESLTAEDIEALCARIKAADDASADMDYMLDSNDCISVLRGTWKGPMLNDMPPHPRAQGEKQ